MSPSEDPRLKIPDELTTPLDRSKFPSMAPKPPTGKRQRDDGTMQQLVRISTVGGNFALAVAAMGFIGWAIQKWAMPNAAPWPLLVGLLLGIIAGGVRFVRDARKLM